MEKSKQILKKTYKIIFLTILIILFVESNRLAFFRGFISNHIILFKGKGILISNICLGILGSAILTCVSEYCEYKSMKSKLEEGILNFYKKWDKEMGIQVSEQINDIKYVNLIGVQMCLYWEEILLLYNTYLPYDRDNIYVKLIKALYDYIKVFVEYMERVNYKRKLKKYYIQKIDDLSNEKIHLSDTKQRNELNEVIMLTQKKLKELETMYTGDEYTLYMINQEKHQLDKIVLEANPFIVFSDINKIEMQDFKRATASLEKYLIKLRIRSFLQNIDRFLKKVKNKYKHNI